MKYDDMYENEMKEEAQLSAGQEKLPDRVNI